MTYKIKEAESTIFSGIFSNEHFQILGGMLSIGENAGQQDNSGDPDVVIPPKRLG